ncbi:MAG: DNA topoisomerase III [Legionellales bacterium]|nr:DNA topoisomerase III [Legionellales bacterium]
MILFICEKPSQARDIARQLKATERKDGYLQGNGTIITWCVGHLLELAPPEYYRPDIKPWRIEKLPVIPSEWKMLVSAKTKKQFNIIKQLLKNAHHVVIASDPDREGECIVREILDECNYTGKIERLWLNALDDISIQKALKNIRPGKDSENLYYAAQARSRSDYAIGMNLTMGASALYGVNSVLSIGRVQTPTLKIVVDRDRAIEAFKPQDYFVLKALFSGDEDKPIWTTWKAPDSVLDIEGHCLDQQLVDSIAAKVDEEPGVVASFKESKKTQKAPLCFSLSALQKKASSAFGYSAKQVLALAQALYEKHKATTYPRTDCGYLPEDQFHEVSKVLEAIASTDPTLKPLLAHCDNSFRSSVWNNKKITAHHAIIPTMNDRVDISAMSEEEFNIYDLIRRQYLAQLMGDYEYLQRTVEIHCAGESFVATGNTPVTLAWKHAFNAKELAANHESENNTVPLLKTGQHVDNQKTVVESKQTKPPAHFTEGTLIEAMKTVGKWVEDEQLKKTLKDNQGIGTEATRANIIELLFKRGYLQRQSKHVLSTDKGRALIDIAPDLVKNPVLTAQWEQQLEHIAEGKGHLDSFVHSQAALLKEMLEQLQSEGTRQEASRLQLQSETQNSKVYCCPKCSAALRRLKNKKSKFFWGCTQYPNCHFTTWEKNKKPSL